MEQIKKDFMKSWWRGLVYLLGWTLLLCPLISFLCFYEQSSEFTSEIFWKAVLIGLGVGLVFFLLCAVTSCHTAMRSCSVMRNWPDNNNVDRLEQEYAAPHPVYRYADVQLHLMPNFVLYFHADNLQLIPTHEIERIDPYDSVGDFFRYPSVDLLMKSGEWLKIELPPYPTFRKQKSRRYQDCKAILTWLEALFANTPRTESGKHNVVGNNAKAKVKAILKKIKTDFMRNLRHGLVYGTFQITLLVALAYLLILLSRDHGFTFTWLRFWEFVLTLLGVCLSCPPLWALMASLLATYSCAVIRDQLNDDEADTLEKEYTTPHPVYRYSLAELHLMPNFILYGNIGVLHVIPIQKIEGAVSCDDYYAFSYHTIIDFHVTFCRFIKEIAIRLPTYRTRKSRRYQDSEAILTWLEERLRSEKFAH